jgi:general stress protein 26
MSERKREHLKELLESFDTAMLLTRHGDKDHARPMSIAALEGPNTIWFVTSVATPKTDEIRQDARVSVTLQSSRRYVALSGRADIIDDRAKLDQLWKPGWKVWFPDGKGDPTIRLIRVTVHDAEFWDGAGTKGMRYVFEAARALFRHTTPNVADVLHGRVETSDTGEPLSRH